MTIKTDYRVGGHPVHYLADAERLPMFIPDEMRKCVAFLVYDSPVDGEIFCATAFFVGFRSAEDYFLYVVTAKHVVDGIAERGFGDDIKIRLNDFQGTVVHVRTSLSQWFFHPTDNAADVAVLRLDIVADLRNFPMSAIVDANLIRRHGIGIGDEVFLSGLYTKRPGRGRNIPIVRTGIIAAMPEERIKTDAGEMEGYLIEARSIGGISGSPVFVETRPGQCLTPDGDRRYDLVGPTSFYLLGLMHGKWDMKHLAPIMFEIDADYLKQPLNSGIAVVVPATKILETIQQPKLEKKRMEEVANRRSQSVTTLDAPTTDA